MPNEGHVRPEPATARGRLLARLRAGSKTLRFRLMLWNAGLVLATALLVLLGLREGVRRTLVHELDQILVEDLREIRLAVADARSHGGTGGEAWYRHLQKEFDEEPRDPRDASQEGFAFFEKLGNKVRGHEAHDWFVRLFGARGEVLAASPDGPARLPSAAGSDMAPFAADGYRVVDLKISPPWDRIAGIRIGASTELVDQDMKRIDGIVLAVAGAALAVAPLGGYWLAGRSLRPVGGIIDTAARLRPDRLDERLPIRGSGDELDRLAGTVNRLLDRIAQHLAERRDFLANSAHELRSPLAAMRSTVEVALQTGRISPEDEETFAVVIDQCRSLEHLVNQLLLIAETEAERLIDRSEDVRLDRLVATAVDMFSAAAEVKDVALGAHALPAALVRGNRNHLRQVVNNLLDNAVKFTPPGGAVTADLAVGGDGRVVLIVADTGTGIAPSDVPHVFDRFFRGDRSRQRDGLGTGLGLSICRAVVAAHGGEIAVKSTPGKGTAVTVFLPTSHSVTGNGRPATAVTLSGA